MNVPTFEQFVRGPGGDMIRRLGFAKALNASTWGELRNRIIIMNHDSLGRPAGYFVNAVRQLDGVASSGERPLLHAICAAMDFAWLADELAGGKSWDIMSSASGAHQAAILACMVQRDAP